MSIEDINYLKANSIKQSYTFLIDSSLRDKSLYPKPSEYTIEFSEPFKNVIGIEVLDVTVPKTMYNIDYNNNKLYYYISTTDSNDLEIDDNGNYDHSLFSYIEVPPGDYKTSSFIQKIKQIFFELQVNMTFESVEVEAELTNKVYFESNKPFVLDMTRSTLTDVLGFGDFTNNDIKNKENYDFKEYNNKKGCQQLFHSVKKGVNKHRIISPGMLYLLNDKYILLRCPEIENHLYRSLAYTKYNLGLAKIRINSYGYNEEKTSFLKVPLREFHPIGKLMKLTMRFETSKGELYDFKGVNHVMVLVIYYYEPIQEKVFQNSILNPEYKGNFIDYMYKQEDQEGDSDEENDFSRDNINMYKKIEKEFSRSGIENKNAITAYKIRRKHQRHNRFVSDTYNKLQTLSSASENDDTDNVSTSEQESDESE